MIKHLDPLREWGWEWISISSGLGGNAQGPPLVRGVKNQSFDHTQYPGGSLRNESGGVCGVFDDFSQYQPKCNTKEIETKIK